jgi:hypothetical protein
VSERFQRKFHSVRADFIVSVADFWGGFCLSRWFSAGWNGFHGQFLEYC